MEQNQAEQDLLRRLRRIEGQVRGIQRMVNEQRACEDIVVQLSAVRAALDTVTAKLVVGHAANCMEKLPSPEARAAVERAIQVLTKIPPQHK